MSFVIAIYVKEGIVLASDSRTTFNATQTIPPQIDGGVPSIVNQLGVHISDTNYKSFVTTNHVGITTCGDASIKGLPITGYIESFMREYDSADVETIANALLPYFKSIEPNLKSIFTVAGYKYVKENQYEQKVFVINTQRGTVEELNTSVQGAHWDGETDVLIRLIQPLSLKQDKGTYYDLPQYIIPWQFFTLQDAIEFAEYATKVTIDTMKFQERVKTVGGPIDILVLKPNSHQWISHKELHI
jgi:hypothetical protein